MSNVRWSLDGTGDFREDSGLFQFSSSYTTNLLVAGNTGNGVGGVLNTIILSIIKGNSSDDYSISILDCRCTELDVFKESVAKYIISSEVSSCIRVLEEAAITCTQKWEKISGAKCKDINSYLDKSIEPMKRDVIVLNDFDRIIHHASSDELEAIIKSFDVIQTYGRAVGVHIIMATTDVLRCGMLKRYFFFMVLRGMSKDVSGWLLYEHSDVISSIKSDSRECFCYPITKPNTTYGMYEYSYISINKIKELLSK